MSVVSKIDLAMAEIKARRVGFEARKADRVRRQTGFYDQFLSGANILDIGFRGNEADTQPIVPQATGIDLDYSGYDGLRLPFNDMTQDAVFASHCLQCIDDSVMALKEWYRVLKTDGYLLIFVPHKHLYERRPILPSRWSGGAHKRFYTPGSLLAEVEGALPLNGFRIRHLADNDLNFNYSQSVQERPRGCYEIEFVIQKITRPGYSERLEFSPAQMASHRKIIQTLCNQILASIDAPEKKSALDAQLPWIPSYAEIVATVSASRDIPDEVLKEALSLLLEKVMVNSEWYLSAYPDVRAALDNGDIASASEHFQQWGYFEGRMADDTFGRWVDGTS
jgi:SAM-dependent methyltransferase